MLHSASDDLAKTPISLAEAQRALYIDFEGRHDAPPWFCGLLWSDGALPDRFEQVILEDVLWPAARAIMHSDHCLPVEFARRHRLPPTMAGVRRCCRAEPFAWRVLQRCETEDRLLVGWSRHERDVLEAWLPVGMRGLLAARYRDAKALAKGWTAGAHPGVTFPPTRELGTHRLKNYLALIKYDEPTWIGDRQTSQWLRCIHAQLVSGSGNYDTLTPTAKAKWAKVLEHNWHDCNGMREVTLRVTSDRSVAA